MRTNRIRATKPRIALALAILLLFSLGLAWGEPEARWVLIGGMVIFGFTAFVLPGTSLLAIVGLVTVAVTRSTEWWTAVPVVLVLAVTWRRITVVDRVIAMAILVLTALEVADIRVAAWLLPAVFLAVFLPVARVQLSRSLQRVDYRTPAGTPPGQESETAIERLEGHGYRRIGSFDTANDRPTRWDVLVPIDDPWVVSISGGFIVVNSRFECGAEFSTSSRPGALGVDTTLIQHIGSREIDELLSAHQAVLTLIRQRGAGPVRPPMDGLIEAIIERDSADREWMIHNSWRTTLRWLTSPLLERRIDPDRPPGRVERWLNRVPDISPGGPGSR